MTEQQVQELATQLDGQIAQGCGSNDPNAKGAYILQRYPQVQGCASYYDAVILLAKEQLALQVPQQQAGFHQPQQGFNQVPQGFNQVPQGFNQAPQGFNQVPQGFNQAPQGYNQVPQGFGHPSQGVGQPPQGFNPVPQGFGQPPYPGVFGTPAVPQTGVPGASQFTAFQPQKTPKSKGDSNGKVFGFIPQQVFAILLIGIVASIVIFGIIASIINANKPKTQTNLPNTEYQLEETIDVGNPVDSLFD